MYVIVHIRTYKSTCCLILMTCCGLWGTIVAFQLVFLLLFVNCIQLILETNGDRNALDRIFIESYAYVYTVRKWEGL